MWAMFFVTGGILFWLLTVAAFVLLIWEVHSYKPIAGVVTLGLYLALIHLFGDASVPSVLVHSPWLLYLGIPIYFLAGVIWGVVKWALYVNRHAIEYAQARYGFLRVRSKNPETVTINTIVPPELREAWKRHALTDKKPRARDYKWRIITWMCYWPLSMLWTVLDEPWRYIYEALSNMFQKMSDKIYKRVGYDQDMDVPATKKENELEYEDNSHYGGGGGL